MVFIRFFVVFSDMDKTEIRPEVPRFVFGKVSHFLLPNLDCYVMTIVHCPPSTAAVQRIENRSFTGSSPVLSPICLRFVCGIFTEKPAPGWPHTHGEASPMKQGANMIEEINSNFYSMRGSQWN